MGQSAPAAFTIMIVEDDPDIRSLVAMALGLDAGLKVVEAETGEAAMERLVKPPMPDLILIDLHLPDMDGFQLVKALELIHPGLTLHCAFLTASARQADIARFEASGVRGAIAKPFDALGLASHVRTLLNPSRFTFLSS